MASQQRWTGHRRTRMRSGADGSEQMGAWPSLQVGLEDVWRIWPPKMIFRDVYLLLLFFFYLIYLAVPGLTCGTLALWLQPLGSSSLTRDQTWAPTLGMWRLSHWTTRRVWDVHLTSLFPCSQPIR